MSDRVAVLVFVGGSFERAYALAPDRALAFENGVEVGAGLFSGDSLFTTIQPTRETYRQEDLLENVPDEAERELARFAGQRAIETGMSRGREVSTEHKSKAEDT